MSVKTASREKYLNIYKWVLLIAWTTFLAAILILKITSVRETTKELAINEARAHFNRDTALRSWAASHGGVYVPANDVTPPNPYLSHVPERDIVTPSGRELTLMNPAYMMRQVNEHFSKFYGITGHITSLKLLRPENAADEWEQKALHSFEQGVPEILEFTMYGGEHSLRLMQPMFVSADCLKCHSHQGYKEGEVRGGISVSIPMSPFLSRERTEIIHDSVSLAILWLLGLIGILLGDRGLRSRVRERDQAQEELQKYHKELERIVENRTIELRESNRQLTLEIAERKNVEALIKKSLEEKEMLLKEIYHRVKNNMAVVTSLLGLQSGKVKDEHFREILNECIARVHTMGAIHERLYRSDDQSHIVFSDYMNDIVDSMYSSYGLNPQLVVLKKEIGEITLGIDAAIPCALIVNEMLTNAMKYAFPGGMEGEIKVSLTISDKDEIELIVSDNGVGMPDGLDYRSTETLGLSLINGLVMQLQGELELNTDKGTTFKVTFRRRK